MDYKNLGETFKLFRMNHNLSLKQIADENLSASQISRFERGETELTASKLFTALDHMHVEVGEFMDEVRGHQRTETIRFMSRLTELEYRRDADGFRKLAAEQRALFQENPSVEQYHLNEILAYGFVCKCDRAEQFPKEYLDEIYDYLFCVDEWKIYELILIGNLYLFMDIPKLHLMGQEIINRYAVRGATRSISKITLLNIFETCVMRKELQTAAYYDEQIPKLLEDETLLYERNLYHFLHGAYLYLCADIKNGMAIMKQAIQIYEWLGCENLTQNAREDYHRVVQTRLDKI